MPTKRVVHFKHTFIKFSYKNTFLTILLFKFTNFTPGKYFIVLDEQYMINSFTCVMKAAQIIRQNNVEIGGTNLLFMLDRDNVNITKN